MVGQNLEGFSEELAFKPAMRSRQTADRAGRAFWVEEKTVRAGIY